MTWANWRAYDAERAATVLQHLAKHAPQYFGDSNLLEANVTDLAWYSSHRLLDLRFVRSSGLAQAFVLDGPGGPLWLNGDSAPIHEINSAEQLRLTRESVLDYLRFFCYFLRADEGAFVFVEDPEDLDVAAGAEAGAQTRLSEVRDAVTPLMIETEETEGAWVIDGSIAYSGTFFKAKLKVGSDGLVEMIDDDQVATLDDMTAPEYPSLDLDPHEIEEADEGEDVALDEHPIERVTRFTDHEIDAPGDTPRRPFKEVSERFVSVLLEDAIRQFKKEQAQSKKKKSASNQMLLEFTNVTAPLEWLRRVVKASTPIVIIESEIPFIEEIVAGLLDGEGWLISGGGDDIGRATSVGGDELRCELTRLERSKRVVLLSFHQFSGMLAAERTAYEFMHGSATVFVGCDRESVVPEPLRRFREFKLTLSPIDKNNFKRIFERVLGKKLPPSWRSNGADWIRALVPADFRFRVDWDNVTALAYLRWKADQRLQVVSAKNALSLDELHGMAEARRVCEELIADIHAAMARPPRLDWKDVDRGLLLAGAPGTGKTSLAQAVAKDCRIKFVQASAASWQAAGALDAHLRAMRDSFAEARRFAPAILFIDEIDSIGSREHLDGPNAVYQTDVINALLEQMPGHGAPDRIIVIGATNYPENVDPALRRAGRLDQVVHIPFPNTDGLESIFIQELKPYRKERHVARDVKERALAELCQLGLTGADVNFFVRGAFRRARREDRRIRQADLRELITGRPRDPNSVPGLEKNAMRQVAVHEAGHALAQLLSNTKGADITLVTIVPRSDGTLGFVSTAPSDAQTVTRHSLVERIETALAGYAAEELILGPDEIGAGAGGPSTKSDLAVATQLATMMVCQSGLGMQRSVRWTETPTPAQDREIDELLKMHYEEVWKRLASHQYVLEQLSQDLEQSQELDGKQVRQRFATHMAEEIRLMRRS